MRIVIFILFSTLLFFSLGNAHAQKNFFKAYTPTQVPDNFIFTIACYKQNYDNIAYKQGTGFSTRGYGGIITAKHIVCDCERVTLRDYATSDEYLLEIDSVDHQRDIALLKLKYPAAFDQDLGKDAHSKLFSVESGFIPMKLPDYRFINPGSIEANIYTNHRLFDTKSQIIPANIPPVREEKVSLEVLSGSYSDTLSTSFDGLKNKGKTVKQEFDEYFGEVDFLRFFSETPKGSSGGPIVVVHNSKKRVVGVSLGTIEKLNDEQPAFSFGVPIQEIEFTDFDENDTHCNYPQKYYDKTPALNFKGLDNHFLTQIYRTPLQGKKVKFSFWKGDISIRKKILKLMDNNASKNNINYFYTTKKEKILRKIYKYGEPNKGYRKSGWELPLAFKIYVDVIRSEEIINTILSGENISCKRETYLLLKPDVAKLLTISNEGNTKRVHKKNAKNNVRRWAKNISDMIDIQNDYCKIKSLADDLYNEKKYCGAYRKYTHIASGLQGYLDYTNYLLSDSVGVSLVKNYSNDLMEKIETIREKQESIEILVKKELGKRHSYVDSLVVYRKLDIATGYLTEMKKDAVFRQLGLFSEIDDIDTKINAIAELKKDRSVIKPQIGEHSLASEISRVVFNNFNSIRGVEVSDMYITRANRNDKNDPATQYHFHFVTNSSKTQQGNTLDHLLDFEPNDPSSPYMVAFARAITKMANEIMKIDEKNADISFDLKFRVYAMSDSVHYRNAFQYHAEKFYGIDEDQLENNTVKFFKEGSVTSSWSAFNQKTNGNVEAIEYRKLGKNGFENATKLAYLRAYGIKYYIMLPDKMIDIYAIGAPVEEENSRRTEVVMTIDNIRIKEKPYSTTPKVMEVAYKNICD